jgi:hypothetical protein
MTLRFSTLQFSLKKLMLNKKTLFFLFVVFFCPVFSQNTVSLDDVKKEADRLFEDNEFTKAYKPYAQLVANFPKDPEYNYRLGVCMIYSEPDKKKCIPYLKIASGNPKDAPKDVNFYLGKAYHINYLFDEAIKYYNAYKKIGSASQQKKLQVDREIKSCENGKHLLSNLSDLIVQSKKQLNEIDYFRSYDLRSLGGKLLVKPEEFKTNVDKKKKEKSVVFLPKGSNVVYFSSYGDNLLSGKDIYTAAKLPNNTYSKPEKVKGINTEFDEDFPFLHPDGKTLYFASKGYNSMGGYDVFKSVFNEETNTWSTPVNLEFPINSPDDDFLFVTDSLEKIAYFSTGRQSPPGKIDVLKINIERKPIDILVIKGNVLRQNPEQNINSSVSVKNATTEENIGTFNASDSGKYFLDLPNGAKLLFTVETPGFKTQSETITLPFVTTSKPLKQTIGYENGNLKITNYFDETASDNDYLQYLKIIEKKAKLDVNEGENKLEIPIATIEKTDSVKTKKKTSSGPELIETIEENPLAIKTPQTQATSPKQSLDNKQLANIAKQDAEEAGQEAKQLSLDAKEANVVGQKQKAEAEKKLLESNEALKVAETLTNDDEKKSAIEKIAVEKKSAENEMLVAERVLSYAKSLDEDAKTKEKEANLNKQYAQELENSNNPKNNNSQTLKRIEDLQKEIESIVKQNKSSETIYNTIKDKAEEKEKQIANLEKINTDIKSNVNEIKTAIDEQENELAKTRKKAAKETINNQITNLKSEQVEKENQIGKNETEIKKINEELIEIKNELDLTTKIKTETLAISSDSISSSPAGETIRENLPQETTANNKNETKQIISNQSLIEKYKAKNSIIDVNDKISIENSNLELKNHNKEIDQAIAKNKSDLVKTKKAGVKQEIATEIKQLESTKKQNLQQIASNNKLIENLSKPLAKNEPIKQGSIIYPITANNKEEAVKQLDNLNTQLVVNDNENFEFNSYENLQAQNLKIEADSKINDAIAKQKKLKDEIVRSKTELSTTLTSTVNSEQLSKEAEENHNKSLELANEAKSKEGEAKNKLLVESKKYDEAANEKYIELAAITKNDNSASFETNKDNITTLIGENKSNEEDVAQAKKINEEANLSFKQAIEIRNEAGSLTNKGAILGSMSNAEEKEAEAIIKQQQAIELLKKSNPTFNLKIPVLSTNKSATSQEPATTLSSKLENVNAGINELLDIKINSYQKLIEANNLEIEQLNGNLKNNQSILDKTPSLKSEFIAGNNKLETARQLLQQSSASANSGEKLNNLIQSIKKQNEAVKQLSILNKTLDDAIAKESPKTISNVENKEKEVDSTPTEITNTLTISPKETAVNAIPAKETNTVATVNETTEKEKNTLELNLLVKTDTTTQQILDYFNNISLDIKNPQAESLTKNSLSELKVLENESKSIDNELNNYKPNSNNTLNYNPKKIRKEADSLLLKAEKLSEEALVIRTQAKTKNGEEKNALITKAEDFEKQSQEHKFQAAINYESANEKDYQNNNANIADLLNKLKNDKPDLATELSQKNNEIATLKDQSKKLRQEANSLSSNDAKLGGIGNAEEKEIELIEKQNQLLSQLKIEYPDYIVKTTSDENETVKTEIPKELLTKKKLNVEKQYSELTNLTNAFSLEYETSKNKLANNLNANQIEQKKNADILNAESKRLLIKSAGEKNDSEKLKLLSLAAKSGNKAVEELNKLVPKTSVATNPNKKATDVDALTAIGSSLDAVNNETKKTKNTAAIPKTTSPINDKVSQKIDGLEITKGNAYSAAKPIPLDAKMEDGLIFRVQIGAFKTQLPNDAFKGLSPLNAETTANGYFRYTAGNFDKFESANAVKNDLRSLGYADAFVVGYYNGKRISASEALALLTKEGKSIDANAPQSAGIAGNSNIPKANNEVNNPNLNNQDALVSAKELEKTNGLLFTVQVGVYSKQVTKQGLLNLKPIFTEQLSNGLFRYTAGIYNNVDRILNDKKKLSDLGLRDAFISAYINGKRISFNEGRERQAKDSTIKMEAENPIVFSNIVLPNVPSESAPASGNQNTNAVLNTSTVQPFTNGVNNYPTPTAENGIKINDEGITYKVQIGAYSKQVPKDVADKFSAIKNWPVENKQINALFIYNIGNFSSAKFAKTLKEEAVRLGITDAFITVYRDGKKVYGSEASDLLSK